MVIDMVEYIYGDFSFEQVMDYCRAMHSEVHKLLLYKDDNIAEKQFDSDERFLNYFSNMLYRFGGLNELLGEPHYMVALMSTLRAAYDECKNANFRFYVFRRLILDAHGYIKSMEGCLCPD
jgi:hypothetical protein